jgi:hypothetical protein
MVACMLRMNPGGEAFRGGGCAMCKEDLNPAPQLWVPVLAPCDLRNLSSPLFLSYLSLKLDRYGRCVFLAFSGDDWCR